MNILCAQFSQHRGPDATSQHKISFTVDESQQKAMYDFVSHAKKGTEVMLLIYVTEHDNDAINELVTESDIDTKKRLSRQMHAIINTIAANKNMTPSEIKTILKEHLIMKQLMKESSKELDIKGIAYAIYYLQNNFNA